MCSVETEVKERLVGVEREITQHAVKQREPSSMASKPPPPTHFFITVYFSLSDAARG